MDVVVQSQSGAGVTDAEIAALRHRLRGRLLLQGEDGYDEARSIWNGMIDRHPAIIIQALGAADVIEAVNLARDHGVRLAVRGGGHNIAGLAVCDGGIMLDLSRMRSVQVDPVHRHAKVEPGALLNDLDKETQAFALAVPVGINSTTGVAGLTLGGGFGWTSRKLGLTIDSLVSVDIVTADGRLRHASAQEEPDLFWAVRGGGGNFGVVTAFDFTLHPLGPQVISGLLIHPMDQAAELMREYRRLVASTPDELTCWTIFRRAPPVPFIPAAWHDKEVVIFALCHCGDLDAGLAAAQPFRQLGQPIADLVGPHQFVDWESAFDPLLAPGARNYWKSHDLKALTDEACDVMIQAARRLPGSECEIFLGQLGAQVGRVPPDATAFARRDAEFIMNVHTRWREPGQDSGCVAWARDLFNAMAPHSTGAVYVNFMPEDEPDRVRAAYGVNYDRLVAVKRRYDPDNLFRLNQNIPC